MQSLTAQNIAGTINIYAAVTGIAGSNITVVSATGFAVGDQILVIQMQGTSVVTTNNNTFGNIIAMGGAGIYEFKDITAVAGNVITVNSALANTYNTTTSGSTQIVRVPKYCQPVVTNTLNCTAWNGTIGGVLAFEAGTLTLNSDIDVSARGFRGGNFATSGFCCNNGGFAGAFNVNGGQKGESVSRWIVGQDGMKGKQANGGGGSNCGNSGGGGGGNAGDGGIGGHEYNGCGVTNERGIGGITLTQGLTTLFMGGGGGGGFRDNGQVATAGGFGGGIVFIKANQIICNNRIVSSRGGSVTTIANDEGSGGGGAGGSVFISCNNYVGNLTVNTSGGSGGRNNNTIFPGNCHGPGGGGGGLFAFSGAVMPGTITYVTLGGPAGTVMNAASTCFNTTFGAAAGLPGSSLANLPSPALPYMPPPITIAGNNTLCTGQQTTLTATTTATGTTTYTWNTGPITSTIALAPAVTTVYTVTGTNNTCTSTATQTIYVGAGSPINVAGNNTICSTQSATLTASGGTTYNWSTGSTNTVEIVSPNVTTTYSVMSVNGTCTSTALFTVTVTPTPTLSTTGTYSFCNAQSSASIAASGATTYTWSPATGLSSTTSATVTANPNANTTYVLTGNNGACTSSINVSVQNFPVPVVSATTSVNYICSGSTAILTANGGNAYNWQPGAGIINNTLPSVTVSPPVNTTYTVTGMSVNGCTASATTSVDVIQTPGTFLTSPQTTICKGNSTTLSANGASSYVWSPAVTLSSSTGATVMATPAATQIYTVVGTNGTSPNTCSASHTILVNVISTATVFVNAKDSICVGEKVQLLAFGASTYTWTPPDYLNLSFVENPIASPSTSIVYTVTGSAPGGLCPGSETVSIIVNPLPIVNAGRDTSINFDEFTYLKGVGDGWLYTWSSSDLSSINCINCPTTYIKPIINTCYILEVVNSHGCKNKDEVCVEVRKEFGLYIPNSFTPNGDGVNDVFEPVGYGIVEFELAVFNRWGQLLFSKKGSFTEGNFVQWDGKFKGKTCEQGTYTYKFTFTNASKKTGVKTGTVNVLSPAQN